MRRLTACMLRSEKRNCPMTQMCVCVGAQDTYGRMCSIHWNRRRQLSVLLSCNDPGRTCRCRSSHTHHKEVGMLDKPPNCTNVVSWYSTVTVFLRFHVRNLKMLNRNSRRWKMQDLETADQICMGGATGGVRETTYPQLLESAGTRGYNYRLYA